MFKVNLIPTVVAASYCLFGVGILSWLFVAHRLYAYHDNHVGWNILWAIPLFACAAIVSLAAGRVAGWTYHGLFACLALLSVGAVVAAYHFNILIPYETWLQRGMPARPI